MNGSTKAVVSSPMDNTESGAWIAGISCRLPASRNIEEFWENLKNKTDMIGRNRWPEGLYGIPSRAGLIKDIDKFDAYYFGFSETEAQNINPMLWHLLEVTAECIIDSGISVDVLQNNRTGVYTACFIPDYDAIETSRCANSRFSTTASMLSGHLMSHFGLVGPIATVDTACSSSLSALEMAVTDLLIGRCQFAIVTGVNLLLNPNLLQLMTILGMLNPTGQSNVFDSEAGGYVRAEGVVSILLTRNYDSCKHIYMKIVDVMVNCDGYKKDGITFPNNESQANLMRAIYEKSGINMSDIAYFEAHSTGTKAGDPVEVSGIANAICSNNRTKPLLVGSVKSNMGHSEATAGLASLMKCILSARHGCIPPQINFNNPNPKIEAITSGKIKIVDEMTPLQDGFIGLNSFGFGGANGHAILKPFINKLDHSESIQIHSLVPITARSKEEMLTIVSFIGEHSKDTALLHHLGTSLLSCDPRRPIRGYVIAGPDEVFERIGDPAANRDCGVWMMLHDFMWESIIINKDLLKNPCFVKSVEESQKALIEMKLDASISIQDVILSSEPVFPTSHTGLLITIAAMLGTLDCIKACSIPITGVIGCGITEIAAAYVDGCLSRKQCLQVADVLGKSFEKYVREKDATHNLYKVTMKHSESYRLGPKVQILSVLSEDKFIVAVAKIHTEKVLHIIHENGGYYQEIHHNVPIYSQLLNAICTELKQEIKSIIVEPKLSSSCFHSVKLVIGHPQLNNSTRLIDANYLCHLFHTCVYEPPVTPGIPPPDVVVSMTFNTSEVTLNASGQKENEVLDIIDCEPNQKSLLQVLGELHLRGHKVDISPVSEGHFPLDVRTPSISHLIRWDHSTTFCMPEWTEFACTVKDDTVYQYMIDSSDIEGIHTPVSLLLYHSWMAINQRHSKNAEMDVYFGIELKNLILPTDLSLTFDMLPGATVQVQTARRKFTVHNDGVVLLIGSYDLFYDTMELPKIPGYDLDINKNIQPIAEDNDVLQKTDIMWEDSWLDFLNNTIEFATQYLSGPLVKVLIDPQQHMKEVHDCANILAVVETCTGLCKAGSVVVQIRPTKEELACKPKSVSIDKACHTLISMVMVYSIGVNNHDQVLIYQGENQKSMEHVMGLVLITDDDISCREVPLKSAWQSEDVEQVIPYMLAFYIINDIAEVKDGNRVLVCPPIDTLGIYMMALANQFGCSVFTSTYDIELRQMIESIFPFVRVLPGQRLRHNILTLTQGEGCEVCIKCTGRGVSGVADLLSEDGRMVQCLPVTDYRESINLNTYTNNNSLLMPDLKNCFKEFMNKDFDDIQAMLFDIQNGSISKLSSEGFPEPKGLLYSLEEKSNFLHPVSLSNLLSVLDEPELNLKEGLSDMMEADVIAMERLQKVITSKPKDYSLAVETLNRSFDELDTADTPDVLNVAQTTSGFSASEVATETPKIVTIVIDEDENSPALTKKLPPTSTPMVTVVGAQDEKPENLHESYIEGQTSLPPPVSIPKINPVITQKIKPKSLHIPSPISSLKRVNSGDVPSSLKLSDSGSQLDLLFLAPPKTPMTPAIKDLLTPTKKEPTVVPMNSVTMGTKSVYLFHSITGKLTLLETLGKLLQVPCYGITRTSKTPQDSIPTNASYYRNAIQMSQPKQPYYLIGYSYGATIALEVAMQMQASNVEVGSLILLDGGPEYLHAPIDKGLQAAPKDASPAVIDAFIQVGALVYFLELHGKSPPSKATMFKILLSIPTQEERVDFAVDLSLGNIEISTNTNKTKWLAAKHKISILSGLKSPLKSPLRTKDGMFRAAQEVLRLKRIQTAQDIIKSVRNGYRYRHDGRKFKGDVHLLRVKADLVDALPLAVDYGMQEWCTGNVYVKFFDGNHDTFTNMASGQAVADEIMKILDSL